jgi:hypothetical protein
VQPILTFFFLIIFSSQLVAQQNSNGAAQAITVPLSAAAKEKIRRMTPIFDGKSLEGWVCASNAWLVKDGIMASGGQGRGVIYTSGDYGSVRLIFSMRHLSGQPDHQACVLVFCTRPVAGQQSLDALGGIQFQPPNGGHWDYRPGHNNSGGGLFTKLPHPKFDPHEWSQVEMLLDVESGTARMAVAQPPGTRAIEVLGFKDPDAAKHGPIALQMHNKGLFDEYKDVVIETDPKERRLIMTE